MRISCDVEVASRMLPSHGLKGKGRAMRTSLAIGKKPCTGSAGSLFLMLCTANDRVGSKYKLQENIEAMFTKFIGEGKATIRIKEPPQDLFLSKADPLQLKTFLTAVKLGHQNKDLKPSHLTVLTPATVKQIEKPKTKLSIQDRKDYPITTSFPKSLEILAVSNCRLRRFDTRMLELRHLKHLDLSSNAIENLPESWGRICCLAELNLSKNKLKFISKSFVQSSLSKTLCTLDLSENCLEVVPHQLFSSFKGLVQVNLSDNKLQSVPYCLGLLVSLKNLNLSNNLLNSIPSSFANLRLDVIDLHGNPFSMEESNPSEMTGYFPTLLEIAGRVTVKRRGSGSQLELIQGTMARMIMDEQKQQLAFPSLNSAQMISRQGFNPLHPAPWTDIRRTVQFCPQTIPATLCMFLESAMHCHCGRVCFRPYSWPTTLFNIHNIASSVIGANGSGVVVPMKGIQCSRYCSQLRKRGGGAWRAWCRKGAR